MGKAHFTLTRLIPFLFCGFLCSEVKSQQTVSADTFPTNNPKYGLIQWQYLSPYVEKSHTYHTIDSEAYFLANYKNHTTIQLKRDDYNFDHQDGNDTLSVEEILLDSNTKGVLITRNYSKDFTYMNTGGGWGLDAKRVQIWDLKRKKQVFEVYTYYHFEETEIEYFGQKNEKDNTVECGCRNKFEVLGKGLISVTSVSKSNKAKIPCQECKNKNGNINSKMGNL